MSKRASTLLGSSLMLALFCACSPEAGSGAPRIPLDITLDRAGASSLGKLQIVLVHPPDSFDWEGHRLLPDGGARCLNEWITPQQPIQLTGSDGKTHPAQVFTLDLSNANGPNGQSFSVSGIPPTPQVLVYVEGITADNPPQLGAQGATSQPIDIHSGDNPAVAVTLTTLATPGACDPLFE